MAAPRIVVVGASLAGLQAAVTLRAQGFDGSVTLVGEELVADHRCVGGVGRSQLEAPTRPRVEERHVGAHTRPLQQLHLRDVVDRNS